MIVKIEHPASCRCDYCRVLKPPQERIARKELRIHKSKLGGVTREMIRNVLVEMAAIGFIERSSSHMEGATIVIEIWPGQDFGEFTPEQLWGEYMKQLEQEGHPMIGALRGLLESKTEPAPIPES